MIETLRARLCTCVIMVRFQKIIIDHFVSNSRDAILPTVYE